MPAEKPFTDLMPELQAMADKNKHLSPHEIARKFVLEEGERRGGVEVIVATDKNGKFLGAGTQYIPYSVDFPPSIRDKLDDPKANLILHHNHPATEEQFFSDTDMSGIADRRGIGWMLMHTENEYSAMRATNRMFEPDAAGGTPRQWLGASFKSGVFIARGAMHNQPGVTPEIQENAGAELTLRALRQAGAIEYHSNIKTGLSNDFEQSIKRQIAAECLDAPNRTGGAIVWSAPEKPAVSATPGRIAATGGADGLSAAPPVALEFNRFVDFVSRQNAAAPDAGSPGRPQPPAVPDAGGEGPGLASGGPARRPLLETGLRFTRPAPR